MKTIIIVNQSVGYLTLDICNAFASKYDRVVLLTGKNNSISRRLDTKVEVISICPYDKSNIAKRLFTWIKGSLQIKSIIKKIESSADVLYFTNPPLSYLWADKLNNKFAIVEYDIYPDALRNVKCPTILIKWWSKRNKEIFEKAEGIITLSDGMKEQLTHYCSPEKIRVVSNWSYEDRIDLVPKENNKLVDLYSLSDKFVVLYSGNIGYTHNVESIINVAEVLSDNKKVVFLIIGDGGKKSTLEKMVKNKKLTNVIFSDFLPIEDIKYSLSCANLGVVTLTKETAKVSVPSKTYNLLSYGIPLLNISPSDSELGRIIEKNNCGESFSPTEIKAISIYIENCIKNEVQYSEYRKHAKAASLLFTKKNAKAYTKIFD